MYLYIRVKLYKQVYLIRFLKSEVKGEIKKLELMIKMLIALTVFIITVLNPSFVEIIKAIFK